MARLIGMSQNTVNIALADLMKTNAMTYRKIGRANAYIVNKSSALFPFLKGTFKEETKIREDLIKRLTSTTSTFLSCTLFGSFAKKDETYDSDLDLLVVVKNKKAAKAKLEEFENDLLKRYNIPLSLVLFTPSELRKKWNAPFMKEVKREGVRISGEFD